MDYFSKFYWDFLRKENISFNTYGNKKKIVQKFGNFLFYRKNLILEQLGEEGLFESDAEYFNSYPEIRKYLTPKMLNLIEPFLGLYRFVPGLFSSALFILATLLIVAGSFFVRAAFRSVDFKTKVVLLLIGSLLILTGLILYLFAMLAYSIEQYLDGQKIRNKEIKDSSEDPNKEREINIEDETFEDDFQIVDAFPEQKKTKGVHVLFLVLIEV